MLDPQRALLGIDRHDELWDGELFMNPSPHIRHERAGNAIDRVLRPAAAAVGLEYFRSFNVGDPNNFRVPDGGILSADADELWFPTAYLVLEVVSPNDRSYEKIPHYAACGVGEYLIVDQIKGSVEWLILRDGEYAPADRSELLAVSVADVVAALGW